jgi:hypothetical protein
MPNVIVAAAAGLAIIGVYAAILTAAHSPKSSLAKDSKSTEARKFVKNGAPRAGVQGAFVSLKSYKPFVLPNTRRLKIIVRPTEIGKKA